MTQTNDLELIKANAAELQQQLQDGSLTSVQLIERCLAQIEAHNYKGMSLHAVISVAPREKVLAVAKQLDEERKSGKVRSSLHGIPILLKDMIITSDELGMDSATCGAHALVGAKAKKNATIAQRLIDAGVIILGKANLTQFCGLKMQGMRPGYSSVGGQSQSPYIAGGLIPSEPIMGHTMPLGSSSGSGIGVAAGFAPISIGSETAGSLISPANRAGLYALKCTHGSIPVDGVWKLSIPFDCLGGMAKSTKDLAVLTEIIQDRPSGSLQRHLDEDYSSIRVGFIEAPEWKLVNEWMPCDEQAVDEMRTAYQSAMDNLESAGAKVEYPASPGTGDELEKPGGGSCAYAISFAQIKDLSKEFFGNFDTVNVKTMAEMIKWNEEHADLEFTKEAPKQDEFISIENNDTTPEQVDEWTRFARTKAGVEGIDKLFDEKEIDLVVGPAESLMCIYAAYAGYPTAAAPLTTLTFNGRPWGVCAVARAGQEGLLLRFLAAMEDLVGGHPLPKALLDFEEKEQEVSAAQKDMLLDM